LSRAQKQSQYRDQISTEDDGDVLLSAREDREDQGGSDSLTLLKADDKTIRTLHIYCAVCVIFGTCRLHVLLAAAVKLW
jgi:hypothetical protein